MDDAEREAAQTHRPAHHSADPLTIRHHQRQRHRTGLSILLLTVHAAVALLHIDPSLVYGSRPITTIVVVYLAQIAPTWIGAFGLSALWLLAALLRNRQRHWAHLACAAVWLMYTSALWYGALASGGPIVLPIVTMSLVGVHTIVAASYNEDPRHTMPGVMP